MKNYLILALILTGIFLTKSCCFGPPAVEKTINYGSLSDTIKSYLPYVDSSTVSFLDTNNIVQEFLVTRNTEQQLTPHSKCKFCCKGILYNYRWEKEEINFYNKKDTTSSYSFGTYTQNHLTNIINFTSLDNTYFEFNPDSTKTYEVLPAQIINSKTYKNVYKLNNKYFKNDTSYYLLFNKEFGILKINLSNGKSISLI